MKVLGDGTKAGNRLQSRVPDNGFSRLFEAFIARVLSCDFTKLYFMSQSRTVR